jgi:phosphoglycerate-specific signal transduction histidine kinase
LSNQATMRQYFEMGTKLANKHGLGPRVLQKFREANRRSVQITLLQPQPEIANHLPGWLKLYVRRAAEVRSGVGVSLLRLPRPHQRPDSDRRFLAGKRPHGCLLH